MAVIWIIQKLNHLASKLFSLLEYPTCLVFDSPLCHFNLRVSHVCFLVLYFLTFYFAQDDYRDHHDSLPKKSILSIEHPDEPSRVIVFNSHARRRTEVVTVLINLSNVKVIIFIYLHHLLFFLTPYISCHSTIKSLKCQGE